MIFGKSLKIDYPAVHTPIFEFLKEQKLIRFGTWTQIDIILLLVVFCCFGYFLARQASSILIALLTLACIFTAFQYSHAVFKVIPVSVLIIIVFLEFTRVLKQNQTPKTFSENPCT